MRVLATVERYAPAIGGAEQVVRRVAAGLAARGHEVHVMTSGGSQQLELEGVLVHRLPLSGNEARGIHGPRPAVAELIADVKPNLLFNYAAQTWTTDCCFELLGRANRPHMVLAPCGFSGLGNRRYRDYFRKMPQRLRGYDALVLHSSIYQDWGFAQQAGAEPMFVVPNGADPPAAVPGSRDYEGALAVTVGSHVFSKGHGSFTRAVRRLARERAIKGRIVAPPRRGLDALRGCQVACQVRARKGAIELVDGSLPGAAAQSIAAADLFLFTSRVECAPLVILEAMAASTPWVSLDVGNVSELAGGIVAKDEADLLDAARRLLDDEKPRLGKQGYEAWVARHRWEDVVERYESVFDEVLSAPVKSAR